MITWLNKQLNEKPGVGGSFLPPPPSSAGGIKASTLKPPTTSSSFKPSFTSMEHLGGARAPSFERSPSYRPPQTIPSLTQSSISSSMISSQSFNVAPLKSAASPTPTKLPEPTKTAPFTYQPPQNENVNSANRP